MTRHQQIVSAGLALAGLWACTPQEAPAEGADKAPMEAPKAEAPKAEAPKTEAPAGLTEPERAALKEQLALEAEDTITDDNAEEMARKLEAEIEQDK